MLCFRTCMVQKQYKRTRRHSNRSKHTSNEWANYERILVVVVYLCDSCTATWVKTGKRNCDVCVGVLESFCACVYCSDKHYQNACKCCVVQWDERESHNVSCAIDFLKGEWTQMLTTEPVWEGKGGWTERNYSVEQIQTESNNRTNNSRYRKNMRRLLKN